MPTTFSWLLLLVTSAASSQQKCSDETILAVVNGVADWKGTLPQEVQKSKGVSTVMLEGSVLHCQALYAWLVRSQTVSDFGDFHQQLASLAGIADDKALGPKKPMKSLKNLLKLGSTTWQLLHNPGISIQALQSLEDAVFCLSELYEHSNEVGQFLNECARALAKRLHAEGGRALESGGRLLSQILAFVPEIGSILADFLQGKIKVVDMVIRSIVKAVEGHTSSATCSPSKAASVFGRFALPGNEALFANHLTSFFGDLSPTRRLQKCYKMLGLSQSSLDASVNKAHQSLKRLRHPDKGRDTSEYIEMTMCMELIRQDRRRRRAGGQQFMR